jgi:hypothetical protein
MPQSRTVVRAAVILAVCLGCTVGSAYAQISDTQPPHLTNITFAPMSVDVTSGPQAVSVTAVVTDDLSGTATVSVQFVSPSGKQLEPLNSVSLTRSAGTSLNGAYGGTVVIPRFSEAGVWKLRVTLLQDVAGNFTSLSAANLASLGLPTDLTVTSVPDTHPPTVTSISFTPAAIDVSSGPQSITVDLGLADDISGVDFTPDRFVEFRVYLASPSGKQLQYLSRPDFASVSGTTLNGVWRGAVSIPRLSEGGLWSVRLVQTVDFAGNQVLYTTAQLSAAGLPTTFAVISSIEDTTAPVVTGLSFVPPVIDTSAGLQTVTVSLNVSDDLSGLDFSNDTTGATFLHGITFTSPSGGQTRQAANLQFHLSAGTPTNGTWTAAVVFPRFSEGGTWKASLTAIQDHVHNQTNLSNAQLVDAGFQNQLVIFQPSLTPDGIAGPGGGTINDSVFGARAAITFPAGALPGSTSVAIDVLSGSLGLPTPSGFSGGTLFVNVSLTPVPPMPFPAPGLTVTLPIASFHAPASLIMLYRLDPITGLLVPAVNVNGGNVIGTVNADGLSATFTGVAHLSTLVGFFPTAVLGDTNGDGVVNCTDIAIVKASFGKRRGQLGYDPRADVNQNGVVDVNDLALVSRQLPPGTICQ